jgi:hypothetical protein
VDPDNPMAATQKYMMYIVPFFSLTGLYWQYGLVLYWVTTNVWTLGQQFFMFRNWTTEPAQAAGATAPASGTARASSGAAKSTTTSAKTTAGGSRTAGAAKTAPSAGRPASAAPRPKTASGSGTSPTAGRVRTGSAARDAAANASGPPNGQNGAAKRGLLRLGRPKEEPAPEPEVPATKVVRHQPVRQARSKRSGKR